MNVMVPFISLTGGFAPGNPSATVALKAALFRNNDRDTQHSIFGRFYIACSWKEAVILWLNVAESSFIRYSAHRLHLDGKQFPSRAIDAFNTRV